MNAEFMAGELLDAEQFFAPSSTDLVDGLIGQYRQDRQRVERVADIMAGDLGSVVHHFINGNKSERDNWYGVEKLFAAEGAIGSLNATYWQKALSMTDVYNVMPEKRREEWREQIRHPLGKKRDKYAKDYDLPPLPDFTEDAVRATLGELLGMRGKFFAERVDGIFRALSGEHITNRPEGFGKRMIMTGITSGFHSSDRVGYINDLRCVIAKFMGRDEPSHGTSKKSAEIARYRRGEWVTLDGGALRLRCYMNGNAHLEVHPDMAWRLNAVLASLYPLAIPPQFRSKPKTRAKEFGLMQRPLPFAVVELLSHMGPHHDHVRTGDFLRPYNSVKIQNSLAFDHYYRENATKHALAEAERVLEFIGGVKQPAGYFQFDYDPSEVVSDIVCSGCVPEQKSHQFYPTPASIAEIAIEMAQIGTTDCCLEPSAGHGGLADLMPRERTTCVEVSPLHCQILRAKGLESVWEADFIQWAATPPTRYDRVVMNPPFDQGRWKAHLEAAAGLVRSGGRLVAILPASARGKDLLPGWSLEWSGTISNEFAGTSVSVVILAAQRGAA